MYSDEERLSQDKSMWLTMETFKLARKEKYRLKKEEERDVSIAKIVNNLILEKYGNASVRQVFK